MKAPFPIQPELTAIAIGYRNASLIADLILPRVGVGTQEFKYLVFNKEDRFTIPNTLVGRTSKPNEVEFGATELSASTVDHALDDPIPWADINNAPVNYDPEGNATEAIMDLVLLDREKRTADVVFDASTYPAANKKTLSGTDQFSDFSNSDPIGEITAALDVPLVRPNVMTLGQAVWTKIRTHPDIAKAVHGNSGDKGMATRQQVAELFELEEILVGQGFLNSSKRGQTASFSRVWGKHIALTHRNRTATTRQGVTFGLTAQWGDRVSGSEEDKNIGMRGGKRVRAGESVKELITASDAAYFFENAVA